MGGTPDKRHFVVLLGPLRRTGTGPVGSGWAGAGSGPAWEEPGEEV